jgi:hypothetical protein
MRSALGSSPRRPHRAVVLAVALAAMVGVGCAHPKKAPADEASVEVVLPEFVFVAVENHNYNDVVVSLVTNDGRVQRIGQVSGSTNLTLRFPGRMLASGPTLQLIARAGRSEVRSERFVLHPGQQVTWTLETSLQRSTISVY